MSCPLKRYAEAMDQPRIAVEVEDDRLVRREQGVELAVGGPVRMLGNRLQLEQVHDVDEPQLQVGLPLAQDRGRGQRLHRGDVAAAGQHHVRLDAGVGARAGPDAHALGAVHDRFVDGGELQVLLLVGHDHVHVVLAAQAVIGHRQQRVGVRRQVDADDRRPLVRHQIDESRVLVREAVVILAPDGRASAGCSRRPPTRATGTWFLQMSSHFACWLNIESMTCANAS